MMRNPILSVIEELRAEGLHPAAIRVHELGEGSGELAIMLEDMVGEKPADVLNEPPPPGVSCWVMARVPDHICPLAGGRTEWIAWIRDVARLGRSTGLLHLRAVRPAGGSRSQRVSVEHTHATRSLAHLQAPA